MYAVLSANVRSAPVEGIAEVAVVYHYTEERFKAFDVNEARQNADVPAFYFAPNEEEWMDMGSRKVAAFLNLRHVEEKPAVRMNGREVRTE